LFFAFPKEAQGIMKLLYFERTTVENGKSTSGEVASDLG